MCLLQVPKLDPVVNVGVVAGHQEGLSARRDVQLSGLVLRMSGGNSEVVALVFAPREPISGRFGEKYVPIEDSMLIHFVIIRICFVRWHPSSLQKGEKNVLVGGIVPVIVHPSVNTALESRGNVAPLFVDLLGKNIAINGLKLVAVGLNLGGRSREMDMFEGIEVLIDGTLFIGGLQNKLGGAPQNLRDPLSNCLDDSMILGFVALFLLQAWDIFVGMGGINRGILGSFVLLVTEFLSAFRIFFLIFLIIFVLVD